MLVFYQVTNDGQDSGGGFDRGGINNKIIKMMKLKFSYYGIGS